MESGIVYSGNGKKAIITERGIGGYTVVFLKNGVWDHETNVKVRSEAINLAENYTHVSGSGPTLLID
jgi:hypothetical protein